jgi:hypothetical protein
MKTILAFTILAFGFALIGHSELAKDPDIIQDIPAYKLVGISYQA